MINTQAQIGIVSLNSVTIGAVSVIGSYMHAYPTAENESQIGFHFDELDMHAWVV